MGIVNFRKTLSRLKCVFFDTAPLIYHLEDIEPYSQLTQEVFTALANGNFFGVLSTISITELLTRPFKESKFKRIAVFEKFLSSLPYTRLVAPRYDIAKQAARLRGRYNLRTPDALLFSTAQLEGCDAFLTNDIRLKRLSAEGIEVVILNEFVNIE